MNFNPFHRRGDAHRRGRGPVHSTERGVVLLFVLIALVIMMIASVALVRSFNGTLFNSGNIAFKRDLQNQAQRAVPLVLAEVRGTTGLATPELRKEKKPNLNYSAKMLTTTVDGIPEVMLTKQFAARTNTDFQAARISVPEQNVEVSYVVDRLCDDNGLETVLGTAHCLIVDTPEKAGSGSHLSGAGAEQTTTAGAGASQIQVVYRITVKVTGPRETQAFYQTTFTL